MSLNHKRRIFRPNAGVHAAPGRGMPSGGVLLAACGGAATLLAVASLFVRSSDAPARAPASVHVTADSDRLAVLDGDTLRVGDQIVRLAGIVAPSRGSVCRGAGQTTVDCGSAAANALAALVRGNAVDCTISDHDARGRPVGLCLADGKMLNAALVRAGWARAEAADLRDAEASARAAGVGIWRTGS